MMPVSYAITGSNRGIGFEFVNQLSANPDNVVFAFARNPSSATKLQELQAERKNIHIVKLDITNTQEMAEAVKYVSETTGGSLDWLINNATYVNVRGIFLSPIEYPVENMTDDMRSAFETNVIGVTQTIDAFLPLLRAGNHKKVISLTSGASDEEFTRASGFAPHVPYSLSKHALNLLMLKYALALKDEGFIFLTIAPGLVNTYEGPPPPPEMMIGMAKTIEQFKVVYPQFEGPVSAQVAVGQMLDVFSQLKPEHSGNVCSQYGPTSKQWL